MSQQTTNLFSSGTPLRIEPHNSTASGSQYHVAVKKTVVILFTIMTILFCCHLISLWATAHFGPEANISKRLDQYFNLNNENNFPSFFSALTLFFAAALLFLIHKLTRVVYNRKRWLVLSMVFLFLSFDEAIEIHERIEPLTRRIFTNDASGYLHWTWVVPYVLLAVGLAVYNFRFLMQLPKPTRNNFILSGFIYVFGAAGIESLEGHLVQQFPGSDIGILTITAQELMEMGGIILFIYGLLSYLAMKHSTVKLTFSQPGSQNNKIKTGAS